MNIRQWIWLSLPFLVSCFGQEAETERPEYEGPPLITHDMVAHFTDSAKKLLDLHAPEQIQYNNDNQEFPKGLFLEFYNENEELESTLIGDWGFYYKADNRWKVTGNVKLNNLSNSDKLETDTLNWYPREHMIRTQDSVRIVTENQLLWGKGLEAKEDFSDYEILDPSGVLDLEE